MTRRADLLTEGDRKALENARKTNCCGNAQWRDRLCGFHQGWADGWDEAKERYVESE